MPRLKVMTWNVLYKEKADNIIAFIKKIDPDILCCQEITTDSYINPKRNIPREIGQLLGGDYRYQEVLTSLDGKLGSMGNAIFCKSPIRSDRHVFVQRAGSDINDYSGQNRIYLEVRTTIGGKDLMVGTTHLSYVEWFKETPSRNIEADILVREIESNKEHYIITGDFNSAPGSRTIRKMEELFLAAGPAHSQKTFTTKPFKHGDFAVNDLEWRLDYIFLTPDIKVLSSEIIKTDFSDHLPIVAEIEV